MSVAKIQHNLYGKIIWGVRQSCSLIYLIDLYIDGITKGEKNMSTFKQREEARHLIRKFDNATGLKDEQRHFQMRRLAQGERDRHTQAISRNVSNFLHEKTLIERIEKSGKL